MQKNYLGLYLAGFGVFTGILGSNQAHAEFDRSIQAEYAEKNLKYSTRQQGDPTVFKQKGDTSAAIFGITFASKRMYANLTGEFPIRDYTGHLDQVNMSFTRRDYSATLGYSVGKHLSVFGGYKYGQTETNVTGYDFAAFKMVLNTVKNKEAGPFIGVGGSSNINEKNLISISAAYAKMDGEYVNPLSPSGGGLPSAKGDASGNSYSLKWMYQMSGDTLLSLGYKYTKYDIDLKAEVGGNIIGESEYEYFSIGLNHFF